MDAKELIVHDGTEGKSLERLEESIIDFSAILVFAFSAEREVFSEMTALVITADEEDFLRIANLHGIQQEKAFDAKASSVNVITKEQICRLFNSTADSKQPKKIIVLTMKIAANCKTIKND